MVTHTTEIGEMMLNVGMVYSSNNILGTYSYANGDRYVGEWSNGKRIGKGN